DREFSSEKYDVEFSEATLEVLPKKVNISGTFVKEYDGNNALNSKIAQLNGVAEGDDVRLAETTIYFSDKQVGKDKVINGFNLMLEGEDAKNYCIEEPTLTGIILPKRIELVGTKVAHKYYNGTTDAKISDLGTLKGVLEGDIVAMGSITAKFEDAESGNNKKIIFSDLSLIGKDKDNYEVVVVGEHTA
ncbi:MAG: YDG domain-containing protein, partial [Clostridia bacterium]